jgi:hypothetical protein
MRRVVLLVALLAVGCGPWRLPPVEAGWVYAFQLPAPNGTKIDYYVDPSTARRDKTRLAFWLRARGMTPDGEELESTYWWTVDCAAGLTGSMGGTFVSASGLMGRLDDHPLGPVIPATLGEYLFRSVCGTTTTSTR